MKLTKIPYTLLGLGLFFSAFVGISQSEELFATNLGLTGSILTPSPYTRKIEESTISWYGYFFDERDSSTFRMENGAQHWLSLSAGITANIEAAFARESYTGSSNRRGRNYWSLKYQFPVETIPMAISAVVPGSNRDYTTLMMSFGWTRFHFGAGTTFGGRKLLETNVGTFNDYGTGLFGGYRLRSVLPNRNVLANQSLVEGEPEQFFGFAGGQVALGRNFQLLYDYNGDVVSGGFRLSLDTTTFQLNWVSESDYDRLFGRDTSNVVASAQYKF